MKRFVSILLVAMLIVTSLATVAFAAGNATVSGNTKNANPGDEVTLTFTVKGEFANYELQLSYDQTVLTLTGLSGAGAQGNPANGKIAYASGENVASHSFTATFKVSESAKAGTYKVTPGVSFVSDRNLVDCAVSASSGAIVIACDHAWGEWKVEKEATCTVDGQKVRTCSKCGETQTEVIKAGHKVGTAWEKDGKNHWHICSVCGTKFDVEAHEAHYSAWTVSKKPTATENGEKYRVCGVCSYKQVEIIDKNEDPEPPMGDITAQVTMGATAVLLMVVASAAFVFKRKTAK